MGSLQSSRFQAGPSDAMWISSIGSRPEQFISRVLFPPRVTPWRATIIPLRVPVARHLMRPTRELGRATLERSSIWSCTGWGLPSFPGHPGNWCALTAPFHPYLWGKFPQRRFAFCCTFLRVATTPRYGAPCPVVFGLSSGPDRVLKNCVSGRDPALHGVWQCSHITEYAALPKAPRAWADGLILVF